MSFGAEAQPSPGRSSGSAPPAPFRARRAPVGIPGSACSRAKHRGESARTLSAPGRRTARRALHPNCGSYGSAPSGAIGVLCRLSRRPRQAPHPRHLSPSPPLRIRRCRRDLRRRLRPQPTTPTLRRRDLRTHPVPAACLRQVDFPIREFPQKTATPSRPSLAPSKMTLPDAPQLVRVRAG